MTKVRVRKAFPVKIGAMTLYCERMKCSAETTIYESSTVSGFPVKANKGRKMTRVSFTGRVYNEKILCVLQDLQIILTVTRNWR